jgi:hypothetical protein
MSQDDAPDRNSGPPAERSLPVDDGDSDSDGGGGGGGGGSEADDRDAGDALEAATGTGDTGASDDADGGRPGQFADGSGSEIGGLAGLAIALASGAAAVAGSFAVAGPTPSFVAAPVGTLLTNLTPGVVMAAAITTLGSVGQQLAFVGALALTVLLFGAVAGGALRIAQTAASPSTQPADAATGTDTGAGRGTASIAVPVTVAGGVALAYLLSAAPVAAIAAGLAGGIVVGLGLVGVGRSVEAAGVEPVSVARRGTLRAGVGAAVAVALGGLVGGQRTVQGGGLLNGPTRGAGGASGQPGSSGDDGEGTAAAGLLSVAADRSFDVLGLDPLVPETAAHYTVDINNIDPDVAPDDWTLSVTGAVDEELELNFEDLTALPMEHRFVTLRCVGEPLNGQKMDTALWTGVPVSAIMEQAGVTQEGCCVMFRAEDDFYEEFPIEALEDSLLAVQMNGEPLPRGHGRPVRALVPGHWGEINVKWLSEIEILDEPADGYWEKKGWHGTGPVETVAKLHAVNTFEDGRIEVAGHAYAGTRGIDRVEVSTNGPDGPWEEADLTDPLPGRTPVGADPEGETFASGTADDAWRMWRHEYEADETHEVVVRAVDGTGTLQPQEERGSFPRGATGWVSKKVQA